MNQDILFVVAHFSDRATLGAICCISQATYRAASRQLYSSVRVRSCDELDAVNGALARNTWLLPHVLCFTFDQELNRSMKSGIGTLRHTALRIRAFIDEILPQLANLEAFALDCGNFPDLRLLDLQLPDRLPPGLRLLDLRPLLAERLAALPQLRNVKLPGVQVDNLRLFNASQAPLQRLYLREYQQHGLYQWVSEHAATLRSLHIGASNTFIAQFVRHNTVFPRLHTLALSGNLIKLTTRCAQKFPAVRSLSDQRPLPGAADAWPLLEHLDAFMHEVAQTDRARPYGPAVRSLRLVHSPPELADLERLKHWATPQVTALALAFSTGGFAAHAAALDAFAGLRMLDVTLLGDQSEQDTGIWLHKAASSLSVVPPHLGVLTLRGTTGLHEPPANPLDAMRRQVPTLRLLRIILEQPPQRLAFAHSQPVDWLSACETVADYLPHWRETRAPWDDIRDI